ncbi:hypothetical protein FOA43_004354 [Brettanomyces nanus]|uniref:Uncharacterized protein n=1 Tax=Eeniella nana TaxID=13502 RepID=A0A875RQH3_EENNA|nr:uncharacterized protein FOA43_004354 [Brettanomyces nanus]QPG76960.1 hypothetical protein FOA43_004354 [Brettanomyces nanus]
MFVVMILSYYLLSIAVAFLLPPLSQCSNSASNTTEISSTIFPEEEEPSNLCTDIGTIPVEDQCVFAIDHCFRYKLGVVDHFRLYYCVSQTKIVRTFVILPLTLLLLVVLFISLGIAAGDFLCPNLSAISSFLRIPDNISGMTLLALGNDSPDIMSTYSSFKTDAASLAVGELVGAAFFVTCFVVGIMSIIHPFTLIPENGDADDSEADYDDMYHFVVTNAKMVYFRDIIFFMFTVLLVLAFLSRGVLTTPMLMILVFLHIVYTVMIISWQFVSSKKKKSIETTIRIRNMYDDDTPLRFSGEEGVELDNEYTFNPAILNNFEFYSILNNLTKNSAVKFKLSNIPRYSDSPGDYETRSVNAAIDLGTAANDESSSETSSRQDHVQQQNDQNDEFEDGFLKRTLNLITKPILLLMTYTVPRMTIDHYNIEYKFTFKELNMIVSGHQSNLLKLAISVLGFITAISWIGIIADELISDLKFISVVMHLSEAILGLTIFAIGNSVGDLISDIVIAKLGFPLMALAACLGGPLMNMLLGIGMSGLLAGSNIQLSLSVNLYLSCFFVLINLVFMMAIHATRPGAMGTRYRRNRVQPKSIDDLGSGAGIHPTFKKRTVLADTTNILKRPFIVPFKNRSRVTRVCHGRQNVRKARLKAPKSYAEDGGEELIISDPGFDAYGNGTVEKRKHALLPRNFIGTMEQSKLKLTKRFAFPFKTGRENEMRYRYNRPPPPLGNRKKVFFPPKPLHDPMAEYAIVLYDPTVDIIQGRKDDQEENALPTPDPAVEERPASSGKYKKRPQKTINEMLGIIPDSDPTKNFPNVPVVIDPKVAKVLRPHQISGVKFLYRCTAGLVDPKAKGCIMADEMGLGKTLQCIALMWTLLRQGPRGRKTISKSVIACPSSLVTNWANEIDKWLGKGTLNYLAMDGKGSKGSSVGEVLQTWADAMGRAVVRPVLIISYETLRRNVSRLADCEIGLILADEGHRLKNGDSLTFNALNSLNCERRVILSGTPIQNDLSEYFSLLSFANPGLLGSRNQFRKSYELDILRGRDSFSTDKERAKGDDKLQKLTDVVSRFIIRRTNDILSKYLPVKYEYVIFCNLSDFQKKLYNHFITSPEIRKLMKGLHSQPLKAIGLLKKLCNHPNLLKLPEDIEGCEGLIPEDYEEPNTYGRNVEIQTWHSGKFAMLERFLYKINRETDDKIVVISNYTQTLDLVEKLCRQHRFGSLRLDGTMNINKRQKFVDRFNDPEGREFVFLLSSKAGGCGINLIGANRLVLMDPDWNPASDQQALARIWRDGQKKHCFIYRFISTGTIEEKIYQRQSAKMQLSSCVVDSNDDVERLFSRDALKKLFQYNRDTTCETHETFKCKRCDPATFKQKIKPSAMLYGDATTWNHISHDCLAENEDFLIQNESQYDTISYAFQYVSH